MQLNLSNNSDHFTKAFRRLIEFTKPVVSVLSCALVGSIIIYGLFLFGKIAWIFLEMLLHALGQL